MRIGLLVLLVVMGCTAAVAAADPPMPEFGKSVRFDTEGPTFGVEDLRGRMALLIFFQSW